MHPTLFLAQAFSLRASALTSPQCPIHFSFKFTYSFLRKPLSPHLVPPVRFIIPEIMFSALSERVLEIASFSLRRLLRTLLGFLFTGNVLFYNTNTMAWLTHRIKSPRLIVPSASTCRRFILHPPAFVFSLKDMLCSPHSCTQWLLLVLWTAALSLAWTVPDIFKVCCSSFNFLVVPASHYVGFSLCSPLPQALL